MQRVTIPAIEAIDFDAMEARAKSRRESAPRERRRAERRWLLDAGVHGVHLEPDAQKIPDAVRRWAVGRFWGGLLLAGPVGTGKSAAAAWCVQQLYRAGQWEPGEDYPVEWQPGGSAKVVQTIDVIQGALSFDARPPRYGQRVLVLEDWQPSYPASLSRGVDALCALVDRRWGGKERYATVITTNARPQEFAQRFAQVYSRMTDRRGPGLVVVGGEDRRA